MSSSSSSLKIVIIGNGPSSIGLVHYLQDLIPLYTIDIIEKNDTTGSAILSLSGPQVISQNAYDTHISSIFNDLENDGIIKHIDDKVLATTTTTTTTYYYYYYYYYYF